MTQRCALFLLGASFVACLAWAPCAGASLSHTAGVEAHGLAYADIAVSETGIPAVGNVMAWIPAAAVGVETQPEQGVMHEESRATVEDEPDAVHAIPGEILGELSDVVLGKQAGGTPDDISKLLPLPEERAAQTASAIPEPSTLGLWLTGGFAFMVRRRMRRL